MRISHLFLTGFFAIFLASALMANSPTTAGKDIVELQLREHSVRIKTTPKGTLYTVFDKSKKALVTDVTAEQLQARNPKLYESIEPAIATSHEGTLDARVRQGKPVDASGLDR